MMVDGSAIAAAELHFREDLWRTAPRDAVEEAGVRYERFGPLLATVFGELPFTSLLNVVQGAAEPEGVELGHLAAAVEWLRTWEVDYRVSVAGDRPNTKHAEDWLAARGYEPGSTIRRYVHTVPTTTEPHANQVQIRNLRPLETERVDDEHLGPVSLGDLVHLRVRAALDQERVVFPTDPLQAVEEVADQIDLEVPDPLEAHVLDRGPLVAGSRRPERHQRDLFPIFFVQPHPDDQD
jgi:hypothetical protein